MKKRIVLFLLCFITAIGIGTSSGRWCFRYATNKVETAFKEITTPAKDSVAIVRLQINYLKIRDSIEMNRKRLSKKYGSALSAESKENVLKEAKEYLKKSLVEKIYPSWYGTEWDFNGITETPCQGKIACGYFVSTTLKHAGVNVNRYKLAQKYSHAIVKSICSDVKIFSDFEEMMEYLDRQTDDVYVVGLDNHVGILTKQEGKIDFVHSSYVYPSHVQSEKAETSLVLGSSAIYVVGNMTSNRSLIQSWLTGSVVKVIE